MTKTFAERCHIAQKFLPDAQYKAMLTALHEEMLAKLAQKPAPAQGWKLVPAQPTDQMRDAGNVIIGDRGALFAAYHAMLAAAPQAQP